VALALAARRIHPALSVCLLLGLLTVPRAANAQSGAGPLIGGSYSVAVTPDGQHITNPHDTRDTVTFTVKNTSSNLMTDTYTLTCAPTGGLACVSTSPNSVTLYFNQWATVTVVYTVGHTGGTLTLTATGHASDNGSYVVTANPPWGAPVVDASPYNFAKQDYDLCANACFALTATKSTVPYFSLDAPRAVTLAYNSDRVNPRPFVLVNVSRDLTYSTAPTEYQLQVKINGALVTFLNGEQTLHFAYDSSTLRIGGQLDASSYSTGVSSMDILVSALYGSTLITNDIVTKFVVVNETSSAIARGWTIGGVQKLYQQSDTSALITTGDGSSVYFQRVSGVFKSPSGEFSALVGGTPSGGQGWTRRFPDSTKVVFDNTGKMIEVLDRFGNRDTVIYDASGRVSKIKDPVNVAITLTYGSYGLATIKDSMGRVTNITVDASHRLTNVTDPDSMGTGYGYDSNLRLSSITDRRGNTTLFAYDSLSGKSGSVTDPQVPVYQHGTMSPVTTLTAWQKAGVPYVPTSPNRFVAPRVDSVRAIVVEPGGGVTRFTVNAFGEPLVRVAPLGDTVRISYTPNGQPATVNLPGYGASADSTLYGSNGLPTYIRPAGLSAQQIHYSAFAQPDSIWGTQRRFVLFYPKASAGGRIDSVRIGGSSSPNGFIAVRYYYNSRGQLDSAKNGNGGPAVFKNVHGNLYGNLSQQVSGSSRVVNFYKDTFGRDTLITSTGVPSQRAYYSKVNRPDSTRIGGIKTRYTYDGLFVTQIRGAGGTFAIDHNAIGWITSQVDPTGHPDSLYYSVDGDVVRQTTRRGLHIDFAYDSLHRLTARTGTFAAGWSYGNHGRVVTDSVAGVSTEVVYSALFGSPDSVLTTMGGKAFALRYLYTQAGVVDSVVQAAAGLTFLGRAYGYEFARGLLDTIRVNGQPTFFVYDNTGQPTQTILPGGDAISRQYTSLSQVMQIVSTGAYNSTTERDVGFDSNWNRVLQQFVGGSSSGDMYAYDSLGHLDTLSSGYDTVTNTQYCNDPNYGWGALCRPKTSFSVQSQSRFTYDSVGDRTDLGGSYGAGSRILTFDSCNYTTDNDGNVTSRTGGSCARATGSFGWAAEGYLDTISTGGNTITLRYDAQGRLVRRDLNGTPSSYFLWDGANLFAELDGTATIKRAEYSYYPGFDQLHALIVGSTAYYAQVDGWGNVIALTDAAKTLQRTYGYSAWGDSISGLDIHSFGGYDRARWKGALQLIPEANLYYMRSRWYESGTGRFLSEDAFGSGAGGNLYSYAGNDPLNNSDPFGTFTCPVNQICCPDPNACMKPVVVTGTANYDDHKLYPADEIPPLPLAGGQPTFAEPDDPPPTDGGGNDIGEEAKTKCSAMILATTLSAAADISLYRAVRLAYAAGKNAAFLATYAALRSQDAGPLLIDAGRTVARGVGYLSVERGTKAAALAGDAALDYANGLRTGGAFAMAVGEDFKWYDMIPVVGTFHTGYKAFRACFHPGEG